jgi:hypothetical protein
MYFSSLFRSCLHYLSRVVRSLSFLLTRRQLYFHPRIVPSFLKQAVLFPHHHQLSLTNEINGSSSDGSNNNNSNGDGDDNDSDENDDDGVDGGTAGEGLGDGTGILLLNEGPRGECGALCHW